jgi:Pvc16 N-terminal domain
MIHDLDESLRTLVRRDALQGSDVDIAFDAPTREWAAHRNTPTVDLYLYDIREDLQRRTVAWEPVRDENGRVSERRPPPRVYKLSYLVTAWTQRPEDEHRLLSAMLSCFLRNERLPDEVLAGTLAGTAAPILATIALPPPPDRSLSDVWSALGGELKPSLDLVVTAPFDVQRQQEAGPPVQDGVTLRMEEEGNRPGKESRQPPSTSRARPRARAAR